MRKSRPRSRRKYRSTFPNQKVVLKRFRRRVREREKRHRARKGKKVWPAAASGRLRDYLRIFMPTTFGLADELHRDATLRACTRVRKALLHDERDIILDFSRTRKMQSVATLLFVAELDRAMRMCRATGQTVDCKLPSGDEKEERIVREVLDQIGLLKRLNHPAVEKVDGREFDESVRHWSYATGTRVDEEPGDVLGQHEGRVVPTLMQGVQIGLAEALLNSLHHAYKADREDGCSTFRERRWWMFTHEVDGVLQVLVCDLGIGIPRSLPLTWDRGILRKLASFFPGSEPEVASIRMALVLGESSTGDDHRGNGLPQIWNATRESSAGAVGIYSGKGYLGYDGKLGREAQAQFSQSILGTLIHWSFPIEPARESDG